MLRRKGVPHQVLNAKYQRDGSSDNSSSGQKNLLVNNCNQHGRRGTDIVLGGNPPDTENAQAVKSAGGLHILGTERHEARAH